MRLIGNAWRDGEMLLVSSSLARSLSSPPFFFIVGALSVCLSDAALFVAQCKAGRARSMNRIDFKVRLHGSNGMPCHVVSLLFHCAHYQQCFIALLWLQIVEFGSKCHRNVSSGSGKISQLDGLFSRLTINPQYPAHNPP